MKQNEVTVEEYIRNTLMKEIKEIGNTYPYLGFFLISSGIEFLGKCINPSSDWQQSGNSTDDFENAIDTFKSLNQYKRYTKRGDNGIKSAISLYSSLRCGLVHAMLPKDNLQLHKGSDESTTKINGVEKDGKLHLYFDNFFDDFSNACKELLSMSSWSSGKQKDDTFFIVSFDDLGNPSSGTTSMDIEVHV
jgi:hypothetical protein